MATAGSYCVEAASPKAAARQAPGELTGVSETAALGSAQ